MSREPAENPPMADERTWAGSAFAALICGALSVLLLALPMFGIVVGMIGIAMAVTARGELKTSAKRGSGISLAGFMLSLAGCVGGLLFLL